VTQHGARPRNRKPAVPTHHRSVASQPAEIAGLKSESGGEIMAHGGAAFVQALSRLGLIDEYRLVILPVALGNGLPLFKDLARPLRVDLAEAKNFPDGTVIHVYQPIRTTG
jgi:dihydrofolate reductase